MADITTAWNVQAGAGDWVLSDVSQISFYGLGPIEFDGVEHLNLTGSGGSDLVSGEDLHTAVLISLFTDRRAEASDTIPDGTDDRRGWWGDAGQDYLIGSRLWLLNRAKQVPQTLVDAQGYCAEALQWLIDDGVAAKIDVACSWIGQGALGIVVSLYEQGRSLVAIYQWAWRGLS